MVGVGAVERKSGALLFVIFTSVTWVCICALLFSVAAPCEPGAPDFLSARVTCLSVNELGDFLTGAFAPLAFLWLIAAVFLQRDELSAQRQELRDSRAVAKEQVEEAQKNVAFIEQQTTALLQSGQSERMRFADEQIRSLYPVIQSQLIDIFDEFSVRINGTEHWHTESSEEGRSMEIDLRSKFQALMAASLDVILALDASTECEVQNEWFLTELTESLSELIDLAPTGSAGIRIQLELMQTASYHESLTNLVAALDVVKIFLFRNIVCSRSTVSRPVALSRPLPWHRP